MTLDEAIQYCWDVCSGMKPCQCKNEHQQLAEWLVELRYRREKDYIPKKEPDRKELRKPYLSCSGHIVDPDADERFSQM